MRPEKLARFCGTGVQPLARQLMRSKGLHFCGHPDLILFRGKVQPLFRFRGPGCFLGLRLLPPANGLYGAPGVGSGPISLNWRIFHA